MNLLTTLKTAERREASRKDALAVFGHLALAKGDVMKALELTESYSPREMAHADTLRKIAKVAT